MVAGDLDKIELVLTNILQNAIKFTPDGGTVRVCLVPGQDFVQVTIIDTGIGIAPSEIERIFEKFYTSPDSYHHSSGKFQFATRGTGLGLAIARNYVEAHHGRIWAESEGEGRGSRFHVVLPLALPPVI